MINFYTYIHTTLTKEETTEMIVWPQSVYRHAITYTNKDLLQSVSNFRQQLRDQHIQPGVPVLLAMPVSINAIQVLLAIQSIGAIPVLPPAKPSLQMLMAVIRQQKINTVITEKRPGIFISLALKLAGITCLQLNNTGNQNNGWKPVLVPAEQAALITHSSGSTGTPKAVYRSHGVLSAQHLVLKEVFPPWNQQRDFPLFPNIILHNLAAGVISILPAIPNFKLEHVNAAVIVEQLLSQQIETLTGNVFYFKSIIAHLEKQPRFFPLIKAVGIGGSPVHEGLAQAFKLFFPKAGIYIIYGSSEAEPISIRKVGSQVEEPLKGYAVGKPCEALRLRIPATFKIQTPGGVYAAGEIEVSGDHVATSIKGAWLQTGDFGYLAPDGTLYLTARKGNERPHQGMQHYQVEHLLLQQKGVDQAAVRSGIDGFEVFIRGTAGKEAIWQILNKHLPTGILKDVYIRTHIPVDARHRSKILYGQLK